MKDSQTSTQKQVSWGAPSRLVLFVHFYTFNLKLTRLFQYENVPCGCGACGGQPMAEPRQCGGPTSQVRAWYYLIVYTQSALCIHGFCVCSFNQAQTETSERTTVSVLNMSKLCSYCLSLTILAKLFM